MTSNATDADLPVVVVGAGVAGLCCARILHEAGFPVRVFEAADAVGGRVRTDKVDGYQLDRGFQILLTSLPEVQAHLDLEPLSLHSFRPGALIYKEGRFATLLDPWREPVAAMGALLEGVGTLGDVIKIARLRAASCFGTFEHLEQLHEQTTLEELESYEFSDEIIEEFFRPFLGGILLDRDLTSSSYMLHFIFRMFSKGDVCLPAGGMQAVPDQLAMSLPADRLHLNSEVVAVAPDGVTVEGQEPIAARRVVVATDAPRAAQLLPEGNIPLAGRSTQTLYFSAAAAPVSENLPVLNGSQDGWVNHLAMVSRVCPFYSPPDRDLVAVSVIKPDAPRGDDLVAAVRQELAQWFGDAVADWEQLRTYEIGYALPDQSIGRFVPTVTTKQGIYRCGDYLQWGSLHHAMKSGRMAAEAILDDLRAN